jgi:hypothetical protein
MKTCDSCGAKSMKFLWFMSWHNGITRIEGWYCPKCVRNGDSPPLRQVRIHGEAYKVYPENFPE